jgi:ATP-dependent helicase/nuclease subunit A
VSPALHDWRARDAAARALARSEFEKPVLLAAGAGSGKTAALVARVVCWCLGPGWAKAQRAAPAGRARADIAASVLARCVAITFTEKAAAEMEERLSRALDALARAEPAAVAVPGLALAELGLAAPEAAARATALIDAFEELRVGTIHAFCARLLREHALRAGLHPSFEVDAEHGKLGRLCREYVGLQMPAAYGTPGDARVLLLARNGVGPGELATALETACALGLTPAELAADPCPPQLEQSARTALGTALERVLEDLDVAHASGRLRSNDAAHATRVRLRELHEHGLAAPALEALTRLCADARDSSGTPLSKWASGALSQGLSAALGERSAAFPTHCADLHEALLTLADCGPELTRALAALLAQWLGELERARTARGLVTFQDLLARAARLLSDAPEIAAAVAGRIDQLLVDEFQDTDDVQCELLRALVLARPAAARPGLFLVGDPKQSIYGWRGADLSAYARFRDDCLAAGGAEGVLLANFRSSAAVLDEVTRLCRPHLQAVPGRQWAFEALHEARSESRHPRVAESPSRAVEYWCSWGSTARGTARAGKDLAETSAEEAREVEARAIAADLVAQHARGLPWNAAAILLRATSSQSIYLEALRAAGIPCAPAKDKTFYRSPEVQELANLLLAALDPSDTLALAGALRASAIGAPDAALRPLWLRGLPDRWSAWRGPADARATLTSWCTEIAAQLASEPDAAEAGLARIEAWPHAAADGLCMLLALRESLSTVRVDVWVEQWRAWLLLEETAALRYLGAWRSANVARALDDLETALVDEVRAPHELARALREGLAGTRVDAIALPRDEQQAVAVLTLHAAKGLEWPLVYLADLHREPNAGQSQPIRLQRGAGGLVLAVAGRTGLGWRAAQREREQLEQAETARLLYVAATRAADRLVLLGCFPDPAVRESRAPLLDLVLRREGGVAIAHVADPDGHTDADGVQWKLPGVHGPAAPLAPEGPRADATDPTSSPRIDVERIASDAAHYAQARAAARAHEQRPRLSSVASEREREDAEPRLAHARPPPGAAARDASALDPRVLGTLVHTTLERPLQLPPLATLAAHAAALGALEPAAHAAAALELLSSAPARRLIERLRELEPNVLGREVPLLAPPRGTTGPTLALTGQIDLLYRDPRDGSLVVADYKTDHVGSPAELVERCAEHAAQLSAYAVVLAEALGAPVRAELWFLRAGRIEPVPIPSGARSSATAPRLT